MGYNLLKVCEIYEINTYTQIYIYIYIAFTINFIINYYINYILYYYKILFILDIKIYVKYIKRDVADIYMVENNCMINLYIKSNII